MATLNVNVAIAILLALTHFGSSEAELRVDQMDAARNRIDTLRIVRIQEGRYAIAVKQAEGGWVQAGEVSAVPGRKNVYQFGEVGGAPVDLAAAIANFEALCDTNQEEVNFEARVGEDVAKLRQVRSGDVLYLLDTDGKVTLVLHAAPPPP